MQMQAHEGEVIMRLVITDTGFFWNHNNPFLEKYRDIVLVVCLEGKAVTDQYECFVSPFQKDTDIIMGIDKYGTEDRKFQRLASVGEKLNAELGYHDNIVFLTDNQPSSLYPFYIVKELNEYNRLHLVAMPPWKFEGGSRKKGYREMLSDLSRLSSILYYDSDKIPEILGWSTTLPEAYDYITSDLGKMMPCFLNGIHDMHSEPCFFDFASMKYIPLEDGVDKIEIPRRDMSVEDVKFPIARIYSTMGMVIPPSYPDDSRGVKEEVERLSARLDGKKVCNVLRKQRISLAEANNIPFESEECPFAGPCAGTCEKCDAESGYLREQLQKIPEEKRIYPQFDPGEEVRI